MIQKLKDLAYKYPNDYMLGEQVRQYISELQEPLYSDIRVQVEMGMINFMNDVLADVGDISDYQNNEIMSSLMVNADNTTEYIIEKITKQ